MANGNMKLMLTLTAKESGARQMLKQMEENIKRTSTTAIRESEKSGKAQQSVLRRIEREQKQASAARGRLGIRSEREIQREIMRTAQAYNSLARSGKASGAEMVRAGQAARQKIRELNSELGKSSKLQKSLQIGGALLAATGAGYAVLRKPTEDQKQLQDRIARTSIAAFSDDDTKSGEWMSTSGKVEVRNLVKELITSNGGSVDASIDLIDGMLASGMSFNDIKKTAPDSHRAMLASSEKHGEYGAEDTAALMKVLTDYGFKGENLGKAFENAMKSGLDGKFEIADMVRELPALLPAAKNAGLTDMAGFNELLSYLQSAANKTSSPSEAANNIKNLLEKTLSADTVKRLDKTPNPYSPANGIDWQKSVLEGKANGKSAVQVLADLANAMLEKDKGYIELQKKSDAGDKAAKEQMDIMKGFVLSSLLPDIQAKAGLLAASDTTQVQEYLKSLNGKGESSLVDKKLFVLGQEEIFKQERNKALTMLGQDDITNPLAKLETKWTELTAEFPNATLAVTALAAAAAAASISLSFLGKGGFNLPGGGKVPTPGGTPKSGWRIPRVPLPAAAPLAIASAPLALMGGATYLAGQTEKDKERSESLLGLSDWLKKFLPDPTASSRAEWERKRAELNGDAPQAKSAQVHPLLQTLADNLKQTQQSLATQQLANGNGALTAMTNQTFLDAATYQQGVREGSDIVSEKLNAINSTLSGQQQTIQNNISVNLDGRIVAEQIASYQINMFNRGAGQ